MILGTLMILLAWSAFELVERLSNRWWFKYVVVGYAFLALATFSLYAELTTDPTPIPKILLCNQ